MENNYEEAPGRLPRARIRPLRNRRAPRLTGSIDVFSALDAIGPVESVEQKGRTAQRLRALLAYAGATVGCVAELRSRRGPLFIVASEPEDAELDRIPVSVDGWLSVEQAKLGSFLIDDDEGKRGALESLGLPPSIALLWARVSQAGDGVRLLWTVALERLPTPEYLSRMDLLTDLASNLCGLDHCERALVEARTEMALLRHELDHRTKNNFQLLNSLLNLQAHHAGKEARHALVKAARCVALAERVQDRALGADGLGSVRLDEVLLGLLSDMGYESGGTILRDRAVVSFSPVVMDSATAISFGLIVLSLVQFATCRALAREEDDGSPLTLFLGVVDGEAVFTLEDPQPAPRALDFAGDLAEEVRFRRLLADQIGAEVIVEVDRGAYARASVSLDDGQPKT